MIVVEKNKGTKIDYEVSKTRITFDDDLTINLKKRQEDDPVHIDICFDEDGELVIGAAAGRSYVAEIDIPAIEYEETESESEGENGETEVTLTPLPLDMDKVTLSLWAIE